MAPCTRLVVATLVLIVGAAHAEETWRGLRVADEVRCSPYDRQQDYGYPQSIELRIVASMQGRIYGPYTGRYFASIRETDIEHIVAASEAHDSGLCRASPQTRRRFANDLLNLTLASPEVNRQSKSAKDAAEWMPPRNRCWFAQRIIDVRQRYDLTIDRREAEALDAILGECDSTALVFNAAPPDGQGVSSMPATAAVQLAAAAPLRLYDDNGNGRITCAEARRHGIAPVPRSHPAYPYMRDGDGDGWVCE